MEQELEYINQGRGGYVVYKDDQGGIKLSFEYGGGDCLVIIYVPAISEWISKTNRPIIARESILTFVAEQSMRDQAPDGHYELSYTCIEIFSKNGEFNPQTLA